MASYHTYASTLSTCDNHWQFFSVFWTMHLLMSTLNTLLFWTCQACCWTQSLSTSYPLYYFTFVSFFWPHLGLSSSERFSNKSFEKSSPVHLLSTLILLYFSSCALIIPWHSILIHLLVDCYLPCREYSLKNVGLLLTIEPSLQHCAWFCEPHIWWRAQAWSWLSTALKLSSSQLWNLRQVSYLLICIVGTVIGM